MKKEIRRGWRYAFCLAAFALAGCGPSADTQAPVITGVEEITVTAGDSVSYKKGVSVTDDSGEDIALVVDASAVDTDKPGDYTLIYTATDSAGNTVTETTVVHVIPQQENAGADPSDNEELCVEADRLLAELFEDTADEKEKARAIYDWCFDNIAYSDNVDQNGEEDCVIQGLAYRKGDCYTYAVTAKFLLTRAGIANQLIEGVQPDGAVHCWNLIDIGEGWYHFDTTHRADGEKFFYKTSDEIQAYSDAHGGTHEYDRSQYPDIN